MSDNGIQFSSSSVIEFCKYLGIQNWFILVEHPQENIQAETENKIILSGMKKKLDEAKWLWAKYLHGVRESTHIREFITK